MQESKFNELCAQYYRLVGVKPAKAAFRQSINTIQAESDFLNEYNQLFIKSVNLHLQTDTLKAAENAMRLKPSSDQS